MDSRQSRLSPSPGAAEYSSFRRYNRGNNSLAGSLGIDRSEKRDRLLDASHFVTNLIKINLPFKNKIKP